MINTWVYSSDTFLAELQAKWFPEAEVAAVDAVTFPVLNQLNARALEVFGIRGGDQVFQKWGDKNLLSIYDRKDDPYILSMLNALATVAPSDFAVGGQWYWTTGTATAPQAAWLIEFMPPIIVGYNDPPDNEDPIYGPATEVVDVNLMFGQAPRHFT